jgi:hypothetical protein
MTDGGRRGDSKYRSAAAIARLCHAKCDLWAPLPEIYQRHL